MEPGPGPDMAVSAVWGPIFQCRLGPHLPAKVDMKILIKVADTAAELDQLFRVRHDVFCREQHYMVEQHDGRLVDRFDAFPGTANFVAMVEGEVVGGVRMLDPGAVGFPAQDYFDFSGHIPAGARVASGSMFVVSRRMRRSHLPFALAGMGYHWLLLRGVTHVAIIASPVAEPSFLATGYRMLAPRHRHEASGLIVTPMLLALADLEPRLASFVAQQENEYLIDVHERVLVSEGDSILAEGESADALHVILDGRVGLLSGGEIRAELGPGASLGEASLLFEQPSAHTAVALSSVTLLLVPRAAFLERVRASGPAAVQSLRLFARHLVQAEGRSFEPSSGGPSPIDPSAGDAA